MLAGLKKLDRDVFRGRVALYGVNASANLQQMFVPFYHGILCMIAMAGMPPSAWPRYDQAKDVTARGCMADAKCE